MCHGAMSSLNPALIIIDVQRGMDEFEHRLGGRNNLAAKATIGCGLAGGWTKCSSVDHASH